MNKLLFSIAMLVLFMANPLLAQDKKKDKTALEELSISGLKFRSVGPAIASGRIADLAVNPANPYEYYVAVASGGVWKTTNNGNTFSPIFDSQGSYSIGCVTIDPNNHNTIWVGTGENNNQRSVAYGDGVYKSVDRGKSWKNVGLKNSEHIGNIVVHPDNSDVIFVAAYGPLWSEGGDRGVYKSEDGGKTWNRIFHVDNNTGVNEIHMDPRNPDIMYAATHQRRRHVYTYLGGGLGSGIHKTTDGGKTWNKCTSGLPGVELGRIGMDISPANPDIIYAIVEAAEGKGGVYRSTDGATTWHKRSSYSTSGNYYQELFCDLSDEDILYSMNTWMQVSTDGGKSFTGVGETYKHVDNHAMWIDPLNTDHWLVGCDGGIYETWNAAGHWDFKDNLPVTQFYKVSVDNDAPFYNIYGGTQDNSSMGGPSRTITDHGITNWDWYFTHGGDGFETVVDPKNPDIVYSQSQYGVLVRYDRRSQEETGIQPKERKGENAYRWNWDAPLVASVHADGRLYFAANKLFRSDDYGNSWTVLGDDLTRQLDRNQLKVMGRVQSIDAVMKNGSTSPYGTIVAFSESPLNADLLIVGTDDGLIQISEDGGQTYRKIERFGRAPKNSYVNSVYASHHDENVMYAALNHHKYGDFKPYIFKSSDKGKSWKSISNNLPERGSVYAFEEDHVDPNLIFVGTEFGVFFSNNGGSEWKKFGSVPTIAVRDIAIQRRENDLVLGTFGRSFYVLDDYTPLRSITATELAKDAHIFPVRDAWKFEKSTPLGLPGKAMLGDNLYGGEDLGPVAMITYYLKDDVKTLKKERQKKDKEAAKNKVDAKVPTYDELKAEREEDKPQLIFTITNEDGKVVRKITKGISKGVQRLKWDMRYAPKDPINLNKSSFYNPWAGRTEGSLVKDGNYTVSISRYYKGEYTDMAEPVTFKVKSLNDHVMPTTDPETKDAFRRDVAELDRSISGAQRLMGELRNKVRHMKEAIKMVELPYQELAMEIDAIDDKLREASILMNGDPYKRTLDIGQPPTPATRIGWISYEQKYSSAAPTQTHRDSYAIAKEEFGPILKVLQAIAENDIPALEKKLEDADAPYTPGRAIMMMRGN